VTYFRDTFAPFARELTGPGKGVRLAMLAIAALFMVYIYMAKDPFMKGDGYGLTALVSGEAGVARLGAEAAKLGKSIAALPSGDSAERLKLTARQTAVKAELDKAAKTRPERERAEHYLRYVGWYLATFFILFLVPVMFIALHPRLSLRDYGLGAGDWRYALRVFLLFAVVMLGAVLVLYLGKSKSFLSFYPMFAVKGTVGAQPDFPFWFAVVEASFFLYFVGWEFFFRGLMVFPLARRIGTLSALVGVLPFAIMHAGKPVPEAFGSILAAWLLGILALRARSFWICPVLHFSVAFAMDLTAAFSRNLF